MKADEFLKQVRPASKRSRLAPYIDDLIKLREAGCTLKQVQEFLGKNDVLISIGGLAAYLQRQTKPKTGKPAATGKRNTKPEAGQPAEEIVAEEATPESQIVGSHNPADLDKIFSSKVDLDDLIKQAKRKNK